MEQNSILEGSPEQNTAAPAVTSDAAPAATAAVPEQSAEPAAAPARRRAPRRVTAASAEASAEAPAAPAAEEVAPVADAVIASEGEAAPKKRVSRARKKVEPVAGETAEAEPAAVGEPEISETVAPVKAAPAKRVSAKKAPASVETTVASELGTDVTSDAAASTESGQQKEAPKKAPARRRRVQTSDPVVETTDTVVVADAPSAANATDTKTDATPSETASGQSAAGEEVRETAPTETATPRKRNTRSRGRKVSGEQAAEQSDAESATQPTENDEQGEKPDAAGTGNGRGNNGPSSNSNDNQTRSSRTRQRERKRRGGNDDEPEITEDDVLLPVAGILDVLDNYAFVRTSGYLPGTGDVYVSLGQVKKYGLRKGDAVVGAIRQPRESDGGGRQKYNAIVKVDSINSKPVEENQTRPEFADFTPVHPNERLRLETEASNLGARVIDLFAPIGKGQRGFIVGQHESGKSTALRQIAQAVAVNQPDAHLMLVVIDERPEDVTELQRTVNGEVIASTFDRPAEDHATIVDLAVERAKRLVELGHDVIVLIDSLTSLAHAYNVAAPHAVRLPAGSLDTSAVSPVKRLLSAARNVENGGSLTIIATVNSQPESGFDSAFLGEIEGIANMQLRLSGDAAERRVFPAIDLARSSTRNEALLTSEAEAKVMDRIRRSQPIGGSIEHLEALLGQLQGTSSNVEFLALTQRQLDA